MYMLFLMIGKGLIKQTRHTVVASTELFTCTHGTLEVTVTAAILFIHVLNYTMNS